MSDSFSINEQLDLLQKCTDSASTQDFVALIPGLTKGSGEQWLELFNRVPENENKNYTFFGKWYYSALLKHFLPELLSILSKPNSFFQEVEIQPGKKLVDILNLPSGKIREEINRYSVEQQTILCHALKPIVKNKLDKKKEIYDLFNLSATDYIFKHGGIKEEVKTNVDNFLEKLHPLVKRYSALSDTDSNLNNEIQLVAKELSQKLKEFMIEHNYTKEIDILYFSSYGSLFKTEKCSQEKKIIFLQSRKNDMVNYELDYAIEFISAGHLNQKPEKLNKFMLESIISLIEEKEIEKEKNYISNIFVEKEVKQTNKNKNKI